MRDRFAQIIRAVNATPWAITPEALEVITGLIEMRAAGERLSRDEIDARIAGGPGRGGAVRSSSGGVAVIPISGPITPRATLFSDVSGGTSMEGFMNAFHDAMDNRDIGSILLDVNSPGGLVEMVPEAAAAIRDRRGEKPVVAVANTLAGSAAYWLAAQADEFYVTPSGLVGSIGVFGTHTDISGAQAQAGIKTTIISAGKYKTEGNTFEPLSEEAAAAKQELVDAMYGLFVADVAAGRGVSEDTVRNGYGEGRVLDAKAADREGMVDGVQTFEATLSSMVRRGSSSTASASTPTPAVHSRIDANGDQGGAPVSFVDQVSAVVAAAEGMRADGRCLTAAKRGVIAALHERLGELLTVEPDATAGAAGDEFELTADHEYQLAELGRYR
jgi:capsid assembly protease